MVERVMLKVTSIKKHGSLVMVWRTHSTLVFTCSLRGEDRGRYCG